MECASPLSAGCPTCGFVNQPGAKFCSECATPLAAGSLVGAPRGAASSVAAEHEDSVAQRRLVSILFADLVGFTPYAEERDSEDVRDTLSRYFDLARDVIERYGGTVEKFIGDAVMAVWGAPTAFEDDAERAVRAGMELVEVVQTLGPGIQARAGVLTGEAAVTLGATNQGMVAGDLVNTASRLQSVAQPGTVLVGESTYRAASAAIVFEPAGDQALKGKQSPVPAWRAVRVVAERGGRNRNESLEAPFVGRHEEMRLLKDLFHTTGREKRLRVVSVIGPAGSASRASRGSSRSTSTAWPTTSTGTAGGRPPTARASPSGRWARWFANGRGCASWTMSRQPGPRSTRWSPSGCPTPVSANGSRARCWHCSGSSRGWPPTSCSAPGALSSSASPSRERSCSCSRTCTSPTPGCSTSSTTCSTSRAACRSTS